MALRVLPTLIVPTYYVLLTVGIFALPMKSALRLGDTGMNGKDKGECIIGATVFAVAATAIGLVQQLGIGWFDPHTAPAGLQGIVNGVTWLRVLATFGMMLGTVSTALSYRRFIARRAFLANVEAGAATGYRVSETAAGKTLMRVSSQGGGGYRAIELQEELCTLSTNTVVGPARKRRLR
jgi:hypothetical protein